MGSHSARPMELEELAALLEATRDLIRKNHDLIQQNHELREQRWEILLGFDDLRRGPSKQRKRP